MWLFLEINHNKKRGGHVLLGKLSSYVSVRSGVFEKLSLGYPQNVRYL